MEIHRHGAQGIECFHRPEGGWDTTADVVNESLSHMPPSAPDRLGVKIFILSDHLYQESIDRVEINGGALG